MMGRLNRDQRQFFYEFDLDEAVPSDHPVREVMRFLDLSWVHGELASHYSHTGRPSIDPELMLRMLILGYVFAIRSEQQPALRWKHQCTDCQLDAIGEMSTLQTCC